MDFTDSNGTPQKASPEDLLKMAGVEPPTTACSRCGSPCDFGQRGDGPAEEHADTGEPYCSLDCLKAACSFEIACFVKGNPRPECCEQVHLELLDGLRKSGLTNMFEAAPFLQTVAGLTEAEARGVLLYWMETFEGRQS